MAKKLNQQDLLKLTSIGTPPTDSVAFAAKSDGLYQKVGTTESKLSTTAELLNRVKTAVPSEAKFTDTIYSHPSTHPYSMLTGVPTTFAPSAHSHDATEITDTLTKVMMTVTERNKLSTLSNYSLTKAKIEALLKGDITTHTHSQYLTSYTDTKYTAGIGLTLSGTQFSLPVTISGTGTYVKSVTHNTNENGITVTLGTPPNTNTTYGLMTSTELTTGTATTSRVVSAKLLSDWINSKGYITSYINTTYTAGTNVQISAANVISATDTKYTLPVATATVRGGVELFSNTVQSVAANAVTTTASRTYGIQLNSAGQAVVNVPWSNTNTTYSTGTLVQLKAGTDTTGRLQTAELLNEWIDSKGYITSYVDTKYTAGTNIQISAANVISATDTKYSLPTASGTTLGGVKIGSNISISSGVISVAAPYSHPSSHPASMITGLHASATTGVAGSVAWENVTEKPSTFAPSTHTHSNISITAGNGLTGGGTLASNRTLTLATPSAITLSSTNSVATDSHTHNLALGGTASQYLNGATALKTIPTITAGNGLTGGGQLTANRTLTLGTPGTITSSTTNSVGASSHTHAITTTSVGLADTIMQTNASGGTKLSNLMINNWSLLTEASGARFTIKYGDARKMTISTSGSGVVNFYGDLFIQDNLTAGSIVSENDITTYEIEAYESVITPQVELGANWKIEQVGTELVFKYNGVTKQRFLADGSIVAVGEVTAITG